PIATAARDDGGYHLPSDANHQSGPAGVSLIPPCLSGARLLVMPDDLGDDEPDHRLAELGVEVGLAGERPEARDLGLLAGGIGGGQLVHPLVLADLPGDLEAFGEQVDDRRVDVVDARPV